MPRQQFKPKRSFRMIREVELLLSQGRSVSEACRQIGVTDNTYYRWRKEYGSIRSDQAKCLKELKYENIRLKKLVAKAGRSGHMRQAARQFVRQVKQSQQVCEAES